MRFIPRQITGLRVSNGCLLSRWNYDEQNEAAIKQVIHFPRHRNDPDTFFLLSFVRLIRLTDELDLVKNLSDSTEMKCLSLNGNGAKLWRKTPGNESSLISHCKSNCLILIESLLTCFSSFQVTSFNTCLNTLSHNLHNLNALNNVIQKRVQKELQPNYTLTYLKITYLDL